MRLLIAGALCCWTGVHAATFTPTRFDDPPPDGCLINDCSLREAVIDADATEESDTLVLAPGTYLIDLNGNDNSEETGDLDISTDMIIQGPGAVLDGQNLGRIMDIRNDADVEIEGLRFTNANTSLATNGTLNGGALQVSGGNLQLRSVTFVSNSAQTLGGGLYLTGGANAAILDSAFVDNSAGTGGGINSNGSSETVTLTVQNTLFEDNSATNRAGAAAFSGTAHDVSFQGVTFTNNTSVGGAGALLFLARNLELINVQGLSNSAPDDAGGFLLTTGTAHAKSVTVRSGIFSANSAENGGVISVSDDEDTLNVSNVAFLNNIATNEGGVLRLNGGTSTIANSTFNGNQADDGGALRFLFDGQVTLQHLTIAAGTATTGSALSVLASDTLNISLANTLIDGGCELTGSGLGSITSLGGNLEGPGDTCTLTATSDLVAATTAQLGLQPLIQNPGATPARNLTADSQALSRGESATCTAVMVDQLFRPRDAVCNSGAVESETLFQDSFETVPGIGANVAISL